MMMMMMMTMACVCVLLTQTSNRIEVKLAGGRLPTEGRVMVRLSEKEESEFLNVIDII